MLSGSLCSWHDPRELQPNKSNTWVKNRNLKSARPANTQLLLFSSITHLLPLETKRIKVIFSLVPSWAGHLRFFDHLGVSYKEPGHSELLSSLKLHLSFTWHREICSPRFTSALWGRITHKKTCLQRVLKSDLLDNLLVVSDLDTYSIPEGKKKTTNQTEKPHHKRKIISFCEIKNYRLGFVELNN